MTDGIFEEAVAAAEEMAPAETVADAADVPEAAGDGEIGELRRHIEELRQRLTEAEEDRVRRERELECMGILDAAGLPSGLLSVVQAADDMSGAAELIRQTVQELVESEVSRRCRGSAPVTGRRAPLTREELMRMPVAELQRLWTQQQQ